MKKKEFEELVQEHSMQTDNKLYGAVALAGEAGEVCNVVKKIHMVWEHPEWIMDKKNPMASGEMLREKLFDELGDCLFYLTRVAMENGMCLNELMIRQATKLAGQCDQYQRLFLK